MEATHPPGTEQRPSSHLSLATGSLPLRIRGRRRGRVVGRVVQRLGDLAETLPAGVEESLEDNAGQHEDQGLADGLVAGAKVTQMKNSALVRGGVVLLLVRGH